MQRWKRSTGVTSSITRRDVLKGGVALGTVAVLGGCGGERDSEEQPFSGADASKTKPDKLVVRSWGEPWSTGILSSAGNAFKDDHGIAIEFDTSDIGEIQAKVQQASDAGQRPPVDVVYTIATLAEAASVQGLTQPLDVENIVTNWDRLLPVGRPENGNGYVNVYSYTYVPIFLKDRVNPPEDLSWQDIIEDAQYRDSFHMNASYHAIVWPFAKLAEVDPATGDVTPIWDMVSEMRPNICGTGQDVEFIEFLRGGQCDWGVALIGDAFALRDAGLDVGWTVPVEGVTLTRDSMYVPQGLPDNVTFWAQTFVNYVIDAENLTQWCEEVATVPTNSESTVREDLRGDPAFPFTEEEIAKYALPEPVDVAARNDDEWQAAYTAALKG